MNRSRRVAAVLAATAMLGVAGVVVALVAPWHTPWLDGWRGSLVSAWHERARELPATSASARATPIASEGPVSAEVTVATSAPALPGTSTTSSAPAALVSVPVTVGTTAPGTSTGAGATALGADQVRAVGFSAADLYQLGPAALDARLTDLVTAGAGWVRLDLDWRTVQPSGPGTFTWTDPDQVVTAARRHHLDVLLIPGYAPRWAAASGCGGDNCAPRDAAEYAAFVGAAVRHFAPLGVRTWELWNEPNLPAFFAPRPDAGRYAELVVAAATAAHRADPGASVLTGGLAPAFTGGGRIAPKDFVSALYARGVQRWFDAVAMHPYTYPADPSSTAPWTGWSQLRQVRDVMVANGDGAKKVWLTEFGAPTNGPGAAADGPTYSGSPDHVSESYQAVLAGRALRAAAAADWTGPLFWFGYIDHGTTASDRADFFGLLRHDGSRKPAYAAFVAAALATARTTPWDVAPPAPPVSEP